MGNESQHYVSGDLSGHGTKCRRQTDLSSGNYISLLVDILNIIGVFCFFSLELNR